MRCWADVVFVPLLLNLKGFIRGSALRLSVQMILVREFHTALPRIFSEVGERIFALCLAN